MNKEKILAACLSATSVIFINSSMVGQGAKPDIVIILADDMGWGDVNANGNGLIETPVLNRFKDQSLSFDRFYVCPLSAPTRAEMLTGRYFLRTGVSSVTQGYENMRSEEITLAEILKENGYTTGCFGKWHNGGYFLQHPNRQGFEEYVGFCMGHLGYYFDGPFLHNDEEIKSEGYTTDFFTDKALEFIDSAQGYPFLCYLAYNVPHSPFQVPARYFDKYNSTGLDSTLSSVYGMVELQYGCKSVQTGSTFELRSKTGIVSFNINIPFESEILPDRDYVKRSESIERTWSWMTIGNIQLKSGEERIVLKLINPAKGDAGLIRAIRLSDN